MSAINTFLAGVKVKMQALSEITLATNVIIGETADFLNLTSTAFPRIEILITKDKCNGYRSQREQEYAFRYWIAGYLQRAQDDILDTDVTALLNFGVKARVANYALLDDKQAGTFVCNGFIKLGEFSECDYEFEIIPKISAFLLDMEAHLYLSDTEVS